MSQFLSAELAMAETLTHIATTADDLKRKARCISLARKAYDAVLQFLPLAAINECENEQITTALHALRSRLEALGECFDRPEEAADWLLQPDNPPQNGAKDSDCPADCIQHEVRPFVNGCEDLRRDAQRMLRFNKVLMDGTRKLHHEAQSGRGD